MTNRDEYDRDCNPEMNPGPMCAPSLPSPYRPLRNKEAQGDAVTVWMAQVNEALVQHRNAIEASVEKSLNAADKANELRIKALTEMIALLIKPHDDRIKNLEDAATKSRELLESKRQPWTTYVSLSFTAIVVVGGILNWLYSIQTRVDVLYDGRADSKRDQWTARDAAKAQELTDARMDLLRAEINRLVKSVENLERER
jgi:hypothetical protein